MADTHDHGAAHEVGAKAAVGRGHDLTNKLFGIESAWNLFERAVGLLEKFLSQFVGGITVQIIGGPQADIRRIWYLTLATAFGRLRNGVTSSYADIAYAAEWDITGKACQVQIVYTLSKIASASLFQGGLRLWDITGFTPDDNVLNLFGMVRKGKVAVASAALLPGDSPWTYVKRGPEQLTIGGPLPAWMNRESGVDLKLVKAQAGPNHTVIGSPIASFPEWVGAACEPLRILGVRPARVVTGGARMVGGGGTQAGTPVGDVLREWPRGPAGRFASFPYAVLGARDAGGALRTFRDPWAALSISGKLTLPDDGRVITTAEKTDPKVQPPQPHVDGRARSSLVHLVSQALMNPCYLPPTLPCTYVNSPSGSGKYVYLPGAANDALEDALALSRTVAGQRSDAVREDPMGRGADGLPVDPLIMPNFKGP